ncbi:bsd domain-containing protein, partial [Cystoisospora suis]
MGASESTESLNGDTEARELRELNAGGGEGRGLYQDVDYPWFIIIQWACERIPSDAVFKWNLPDIKADVLDLIADAPTFVARCPQDLAFQKFEFSLSEDEVFVEWATILLKLHPSLADVRYKLVPAKISEEEFWARFFSAVRRCIQRHVLGSADEEGEEEEGERQGSSHLSSSSRVSLPSSSSPQPTCYPPPSLISSSGVSTPHSSSSSSSSAEKTLSSHHLSGKQNRSLHAPLTTVPLPPPTALEAIERKERSGERGDAFHHEDVSRRENDLRRWIPGVGMDVPSTSSTSASLVSSRLHPMSTPADHTEEQDKTRHQAFPSCSDIDHTDRTLATEDDLRMISTESVMVGKKHYPLEEEEEEERERREVSVSTGRVSSRDKYDVRREGDQDNRHVDTRQESVDTRDTQWPQPKRQEMREEEEEEEGAWNGFPPHDQNIRGPSYSSYRQEAHINHTGTADVHYA